MGNIRDRGGGGGGKGGELGESVRWVGREALLVDSKQQRDGVIAPG